MGNSLLPIQSADIDYRFVLLAHVICADQQIHSQELRAIKGLAHQLNVNEVTLQAIEKILGQDDTQISSEIAARAIPAEQRDDLLLQALAIAHSDGYFAPLEREFIDRLAQLWGINTVEQVLKAAQGVGIQPRSVNHDALSAGARLLKGTETLLSKPLVDALTDLAPQSVVQRIEQLHREILLSGPQYDEAIRRCAEIATEDIIYAERALEQTSRSLKTLGPALAVATVGIDLYDMHREREYEHQMADIRRDITSQLKAIAADLELQMQAQLQQFESDVYDCIEQNIAEARQQTAIAMAESREELGQLAAIRQDLQTILRDIVTLTGMPKNSD